MKAITTHGIKIDLKSLRKAAKDTVNCCADCRNVIFFDMENGDVWTRFAWPGEDFTYRDECVLQIAGCRQHHTQQWIADRIKEKVLETKRAYNYIGLDFPYNDILE